MIKRLLPLVLVLGSIVAGPAGLSHAASIVAQPVKLGLRDPTAFTFAPNGRIYYVERTADRIMILNVTTGRATTFYTIKGGVSTVGIALHPSFPAKPWVYVYGTRTIAGVRYDQLLRLTAKNGKGVNPKVLLSRLAAPPGPASHHGGRLLFGPDGLLYLVIGDEADPAHSQDPAELSGKVLRVNANGIAAPPNPVEGSPVFASGIRNSIGFDFDPQTGHLWMVDNGPECNDEVDLIRAGANYGWGPSETCSTPPSAPANTNQDGANPVLPRFFLPTTVGPTGLAFCDACGLGAGTNGTMFFGDVNGMALHEVTLNAQRDDVLSESVVFTHTSMILSIEEGPGHVLYFSDPTGIYRLTVA